MLDRANAEAELSEKPADPTDKMREDAVDDDLARLKKEECAGHH